MAIGNHAVSPDKGVVTPQKDLYDSQVMVPKIVDKGESNLFPRIKI